MNYGAAVAYSAAYGDDGATRESRKRHQAAGRSTLCGLLATVGALAAVVALLTTPLSSSATTATTAAAEVAPPTPPEPPPSPTPTAPLTAPPTAREDVAPPGATVLPLDIGAWLRARGERTEGMFFPARAEVFFVSLSSFGSSLRALCSQRVPSSVAFVCRRRTATKPPALDSPPCSLSLSLGCVRRRAAARARRAEA